MAMHSALCWIRGIMIAGPARKLHHDRLRTLARAELDQYRTRRDGRHEPGRHQHLQHERGPGQPDGQPAMPGTDGELGRAPRRESWCQSMTISVCAASSTKKKKKTTNRN